MSRETLEASTKRTAAARARRLAYNLDGDDKKRVLAFALDLEAQAVALEQALSIEVPPLPQHQRSQPQQQPQAGERPHKADKDKE